MKAEDAPLATRFDSPGSSPGFLLWKLSNAWQRQQRMALRRHHLTHVQFVLLATASWYGQKEKPTQALLGKLAGVDPMTTSQVLRVLERARLVQRLPNPDDPRARALKVTATGHALARKAIEAVEKTDAAFFAPLGHRSDLLIELFQLLANA